MKLGENAHIFFKSHVKENFFFDKFVPPNFLKAVGCISYFLNDDAFETRVYLQNYIPLMSGDPEAGVKWCVDFYSSKGKRVAHKEGAFKGPQGAVIDVGKLGDVGEFGVVRTYIWLDDKTHKMDKPLRSIFFTEFSEKGKREPRKIISHSLGSPTAGIYDYDRSFTGIILQSKVKPYLLIANGTLLKSLASSRATGVLTITNSDRQDIRMVLPDIRESLGSRKIDLLDGFPNLRSHVGNKPFSINIKGRNILSKPFMILVGDHTFLGDHL